MITERVSCHHLDELNVAMSSPRKRNQNLSGSKASPINIILASPWTRSRSADPARSISTSRCQERPFCLLSQQGGGKERRLLQLGPGTARNEAGCLATLPSYCLPPEQFMVFQSSCPSLSAIPSVLSNQILPA